MDKAKKILSWVFKGPFWRTALVVVGGWVALNVIATSRYVREKCDQGWTLVSNTGSVVSGMVPWWSSATTSAASKSALPPASVRVTMYLGEQIESTEAWTPVQLDEHEYQVVQFNWIGNCRIRWRAGPNCVGCIDPLDGKTLPDGTPDYIHVEKGVPARTDRQLGDRVIVWGRGMILFQVIPRPE